MVMISAEYVAGFFDGEGCISARGNRAHVVIAITQGRREILDEIQESLGFGYVRGLNGGKHFRYEVTHQRHVRTFIKVVYPYSRVKKTQLRLGWAMSHMEPKRRMSHKQELKDLKR